VTESDPFLRTDAAYVLGALDPAERDAFEKHLLTCDDCAARVRELRPVPALLAGLGEQDFLTRPTGALHPAADDQPPDPLLPALLRAVRRENRRRHWLTGSLIGLAAACLLALVVAVWPSSSPHPARAVAMTALAPSPVSATVALQAKKWGTEIDLNCRYTNDTLPAGYEYELVAIDRGNHQEQLGSWTLDPGRPIVYKTGTALPENQIKSVQIQLPDGTPILQLTT
jgi:anti-sigma-K factor RskA